jgi:non-ribosomal peptide synthetase component E (peptide arylation enzyme)
VDAEEILNSLRGKMAGWWIPDQIVCIAAMPLAVTGKIDKKQLRADYASGKIAAEGENYFG